MEIENCVAKVDGAEEKKTSQMDTSPEAKIARFKKYSEIRVNALLKTIELIARLANKHTYEYTPEQVEKVFGVIDDALAEAKQKFATSPKKKPTKFEL